MRSTLLVILALSLTACSASEYGLSGDTELLLSATSGAEEGYASRSGYAATTPVDDADQPPLFRECDAEGNFLGLMERYDADGDGQLRPPEEEAVTDAHAGRDPREEQMVQDRWHMLGLIYDLDGDGELSDSERATLFEDFTLRCESLHAQILADFDADGDGVLSEEEQATAEATIREQHEQAASEYDGGGTCDGEPPEGGGQGGQPPEGGEMGDRSEGGPPSGDSAGERPDPDSVPPGLSEFDTDGDGQWSADELAALRETAREQIRSGAPLGPRQ